MKLIAVLIFSLSAWTAHAGDAVTCTDAFRNLTVSEWSAQQPPTATFVYPEIKLVQIGKYLKKVMVKKTVSAECTAVSQADEPAFACEMLADSGTTGFHILLTDTGDGTFAASVVAWGVGANAQPQPLKCAPQN